MNFLDLFEKVSGLPFNKNKCYFITSKRIPNDRLLSISNLTGFNQAQMPIKYLGVPLFVGRGKYFLFDDLITSVHNRLLSWKSNFLSFGGRIVLIKSVLCTFPVYSFQSIFPTQTVCDRLHKIINKFFWRGTSSSAKIHWAAWDKCCGVLEEGGLGCKKFMDLAKAFSFRLWYKLHANVNLWANFMTAKYCNSKHPTNCFSKQGDSRVWKRLCRIKWEAEAFIFWGIGGGNTFSGKIVGLVNILLIPFSIKFLANEVPDCIIQRIGNLLINTASRDILLCDLSKDGGFLLKSAWHTFRVKNNKDTIFLNIWHKSIPTTISVFVWRILHRFIPTDDNLIKKGCILPSKCQCCFHKESTHHVFYRVLLLLELRFISMICFN
ncbi:Putative ribonuclease H protein [Dendrobium catenatum]|uniref:Ribonuclease H protein n=1 Tax=Dendrobium catenatum TaxID=906689 RepID=A0A2I0V9E3_9ASPA|nr:Putative ribonuclease H protein [Dendrobium catenatum]